MISNVLSRNSAKLGFKTQDTEVDLGRDLRSSVHVGTVENYSYYSLRWHLLIGIVGVVPCRAMVGSETASSCSGAGAGRVTRTRIRGVIRGSPLMQAQIS
jgi:hypothetical protein